MSSVRASLRLILSEGIGQGTTTGYGPKGYKNCSCSRTKKCGCERVESKACAKCGEKDCDCAKMEARTIIKRVMKVRKMRRKGARRMRY